MKKVIFFLYFTFSCSFIYSQWIEVDSNYVFLKHYNIVFESGLVESCGISNFFNDSTNTKFYINVKEFNLIFFKKFKYNMLSQTGYYKVVYSNSKDETMFKELYFCLKKDLIWTNYKNGIFINIEFYDNDSLINPSPP